MKKFIFFIIIIFSNLYCQNLSNLELIDGYARPLLENDNGFLFSYYCHDRGKVEAFLQFDKFDISLFRNKIDNYGKTQVKIVNKIVYDKLSNSSSQVIGFDLSVYHYSLNTYKRSEIRIPLSAIVNAPYGKMLYQLPFKPIDKLKSKLPKPVHMFNQKPDKPVLLGTDIRKSVVNPIAVLGLISGVSISIGGVYLKKKADDDEKKMKIADVITVGGGIIALYSLVGITHYVDDTYSNEQNEEKNRNALWLWENECDKVDNFNRSVERKWEEENYSIERQNNNILESWEKENNRIMRLNDLIKKTFEIIIRVRL